MVVINSITTFDELQAFQSKFKHVILRFGAPWCSSCNKLKQPINEWISYLKLDNVVLLDVDLETYESDSRFSEFVEITKLPTFYSKDKFVIVGTNIDKIKSSILLLEGISEDF